MSTRAVIAPAATRRRARRASPRAAGGASRCCSASLVLAALAAAVVLPRLLDARCRRSRCRCATRTSSASRRRDKEPGPGARSPRSSTPSRASATQTSHAGARGLMQITPATAQYIARLSGGTRVRAGRPRDAADQHRLRLVLPALPARPLRRQRGAGARRLQRRRGQRRPLDRARERERARFDAPRDPVPRDARVRRAACSTRARATARSTPRARASRPSAAGRQPVWSNTEVCPSIGHNARREIPQHLARTRARGLRAVPMPRRGPRWMLPSHQLATGEAATPRQGSRSDGRRKVLRGDVWTDKSNTLGAASAASLDPQGDGPRRSSRTSRSRRARRGRRLLDAASSPRRARRRRRRASAGAVRHRAGHPHELRRVAVEHVEKINGLGAKELAGAVHGIRATCRRTRCRSRPGHADEPARPAGRLRPAQFRLLVGQGSASRRQTGGREPSAPGTLQPDAASTPSCRSSPRATARGCGSRSPTRAARKPVLIDLGRTGQDARRRVRRLPPATTSPEDPHDRAHLPHASRSPAPAARAPVRRSPSRSRSPRLPAACGCSCLHHVEGGHERNEPGLARALAARRHAGAAARPARRLARRPGSPRRLVAPAAPTPRRLRRRPRRRGRASPPPSSPGLGNPPHGCSSAPATAATSSRSSCTCCATARWPSPSTCCSRRSVALALLRPRPVGRAASSRWRRRPLAPAPGRCAARSRSSSSRRFVLVASAAPSSPPPAPAAGRRARRDAPVKSFDVRPSTSTSR